MICGQCGEDKTLVFLSTSPGYNRCRDCYGDERVEAVDRGETFRSLTVSSRRTQDCDGTLILTADVASSESGTVRITEDPTPRPRREPNENERVLQLLAEQLQMLEYNVATTQEQGFEAISNELGRRIRSGRDDFIVGYTPKQRSAIRKRFKQLRAQHKKEVEDLKKEISKLRNISRVRLAPGELR